MTTEMNHIYTAPLQPATKWKWSDLSWRKPVTVHWPGNRLMRCGCCGRMRPAKNCVVQIYYDDMKIWCAPDKGCKKKSQSRIRKKRSTTRAKMIHP